MIVKSRMKRALTTTVGVVCLTAATLVAAGPSAHAEVRCNGSHAPGALSGTARNDTNRAMWVKGDRWNSSKRAYETWWGWIDPGFSAWSWAQVCDADFLMFGTAYSTYHLVIGGQPVIKNLAANEKLKISSIKYTCSGTKAVICRW